VRDLVKCCLNGSPWLVVSAHALIRRPQQNGKGIGRKWVRGRRRERGGARERTGRGQSRALFLQTPALHPAFQTRRSATARIQSVQLSSSCQFCLVTLPWELITWSSSLFVRWQHWQQQRLKLNLLPDRQWSGEKTPYHIIVSATLIPTPRPRGYRLASEAADVAWSHVG